MATQIVPAPASAERTTVRRARIAALRESIARRALASIGTPADACILQIVRTGTVLTVVTEQPGETFRYSVDSFRFPTPDDTDPDFDEGDAPKRWFCVDENCGAGRDEIPRMLARALDYAAVLQETAVTA